MRRTHSPLFSRLGRLISSAAATALLLAACDLRIDTDDGSVRLRWDAPNTADPVDELVVVGDAVVEVYVAPWLARATVTARGSGGLEGVALESAGGRLSLIGATAPGAVAVVELPRVERVQLVGDGRVALYDASGDRLALGLVGDGTVSAEGRVRELRVDARGEGRVEATQLRADTGVVWLEGAAIAAVCVSGGLDASVGGDAALIRRCAE